MKLTKIMNDPAYGGCGGVILAKCENCTTRLSSCYEEDCGIQNEANQKLAIIEAMMHDADGNEAITIDRLREFADDETKGRSTGIQDRNGTIIRERDIVRVTFFDNDFKREYVREECEVVFDKGAFGFIWGNRKEFNPLCSFCCVGTVVFFEIIGHADRALAAEGAE